MNEMHMSGDDTALIGANTQFKLHVFNPGLGVYPDLLAVYSFG
jgi:hypothetical protein